MNARIQAMIARGALRTEAAAPAGARAMIAKAQTFLDTARDETERAPAVA